MAQLNFDASRVSPDVGFDVVPAGWYNVMVDQSELKPTNDGSGTRLNFRYVILDGQYQGRKIFHGLNLQNANAQTVEIAYKQLSALAHAVGHTQVGDSSELHNRPLKIKVKVRPPKDGYDEQNDISQWKNINEQVGAAPAQQVQPGPPGGGWTPPAQPAAPQGWGAPPAAQTAMPAAPAAPWGAPPTAQQPVQQPPVQPPQFAPPQQPGQPVNQQAPAGWTPPAAPQPWAQGQPQQGAQPQQQAPQAAAPMQPQGPNPAQGAAPPWHRPQG